MKNQDCDFNPMKVKLKENLTEISKELNHYLEAMENENQCLLGEFAHIRDKFFKIESLASSFYLQCYLSPFTDKYLDLSTSIRNLSKRKHGALIIVQRNDPLDSLIHHGVLVEATFTSSLLESIFFPGSPLHDGAVLIKGNQIVSAAHILPLSNIKITDEKKLGTRHRAAMGLSRLSDALVIVVSEETGNASFAFKEKLYPLNASEVPI